jgi:sugar lactone lactonase YvrE
MRCIVTILAIAVLGFAATSPWKPIALTVLPDGNLFVLSPDHFDLGQPLGSIKRVALPLSIQWIDGTVIGASSNQKIFLIGRGNTQQSSPILQVDAQGKELRRWRLPNGFPAGITADASKEILYVTDLQAPSVYTIRLADKNGIAQFLAEVPRVNRLSAIAIAPTGHLFVADAFEGKIYRMAPPLYQPTVLASDLGEPSAIAVSPNGRILYVADRSRHCVWSIRLDAANPRPTRFWSDNLRAPSAVGVGANGAVWIGDRVTDAVLGVTPEGRLIQRNS